MLRTFWEFVGSRYGGDEGIRTPDLGVANATLSQLSYIPFTHILNPFYAIFRSLTIILLSCNDKLIKYAYGCINLQTPKIKAQIFS